MKYDYDGSGKEREIVASPYTLMVYEQQFKRGMIEDVLGRLSLSGHEDDIDEDGNLVVADYTIDHWTQYTKALWAMLKAGAALARAEHREYDEVPNYEDWAISAVNIDLKELSEVVVVECYRGLFRAGAAASEDETSTGEED